MGQPFLALPDLMAISHSPQQNGAKSQVSKGDRLAFAQALSQVDRRPESKGVKTTAKTLEAPAPFQEPPGAKDAHGASLSKPGKADKKLPEDKPLDAQPQATDSNQATAQLPASEANPPAPQALSPQDLAQFSSVLMQASVQGGAKTDAAIPSPQGVQLAKSLTILSAQDSVAQATMATLSDSSKPATEFAGLQAQQPNATLGPSLVSPQAPGSGFAEQLAEAQAKIPIGTQVPAEAQAKIPTGTQVSAEAQANIPIGTQVPAEAQAKIPTEAEAKLPQSSKLPDLKASNRELQAASQPATSQLDAALQQVTQPPSIQPTSKPGPSEASSKAMAISGPDASSQVQSEVTLEPSAIDPSKQPQQGPSQDGSQEGQEQRDGAPKAPRPPMSPVASQTVPQSVENLRAAVNMTSLRAGDRPEQAPPSNPTPSPSASAIGLAPNESASLEAVPGAKKVEVHPWELGVQPVETPMARLQGTPKEEALPLKEAMRTPFFEAAKQPGKPSELRLELSPEHLGRMEIRVMAHEGIVSAQIRVDHAGTRDLMQVQLAELRANLADQGIKIDKLEVNVGQDQRRQGQGFDMAGGFQQGAGHGQNQQPSSQSQAMGARFLNFGPEDADSDEEAPKEGGRHARAGGPAGIDFQA